MFRAKQSNNNNIAHAGWSFETDILNRFVFSPNYSFHFLAFGVQETVEGRHYHHWLEASWGMIYTQLRMEHQRCVQSNIFIQNSQGR